MDCFEYIEGLYEYLFRMKLAYPYEKFNLDNLHQPLVLVKEDNCSTLTQSYHFEADIARMMKSFTNTTSHRQNNYLCCL